MVWLTVKTEIRDEEGKCRKIPFEGVAV